MRRPAGLVLEGVRCSDNPEGREPRHRHFDRAAAPPSRVLGPAALDHDRISLGPRAGLQAGMVQVDLFLNLPVGVRHEQPPGQFGHRRTQRL